MDKFNIFIDESGTADVKTYKSSNYYTICGLMITEKSRGILKPKLEQLKQKHFGNKNYILHGEDLRWKLHRDLTRIKGFARDLEKILDGVPFFLLFVTFDKEKAFRLGWVKSTIYDRGYRSIIGNLVKFAIAKKVRGNIIVEASSTEQDIHLYKSFFHYITNGISRLSITSEDVKRHLTSINFVTKLNNDPEEQLVDLLSICGKLQLRILKNEIKIEDLDPINSVLYSIMLKRLFGIQAKNPRKDEIYKEINPFVEFP